MFSDIYLSVNTNKTRMTAFNYSTLSSLLRFNYSRNVTFTFLSNFRNLNKITRCTIYDLYEKT